ncbi:MAG: UPF0175 family protein [Plectolyngbya sp. WJT66-NPBG17]|jgi:predicted HTH domain antitoxin|nr:UPF0175 family protein [Plectolyngbya sp. WJT66-NPBG17]
MAEDELKLEIALMLFKQQKISSGKVRSWTGLTVLEFQHELARRGLYLNYDVEDFQSDSANAPIAKLAVIVVSNSPCLQSADRERGTIAFPSA